MKTPYILSRIIMLLVCVVGCAQLQAQSTQQIYRWHTYDKAIKISSATADSFRNYPESDYTPPNNMELWEAKEKLNAYAKSAKQLSLLCILTVDEAGKITNVKTLTTSDKPASDAVIALIKNTKTAGPSYLKNKAVASYVPCSITITKNQITIL